MKNHFTRFSLLCLFLLNVSFLSYADTVTSIATGNWKDGTTWSTGSVPGSGDDVVIADGTVVTIATTQTISDLTISGTSTTNYGKLIITTSADLTTTGSTTVYGVLVINDGIFNEGNSTGDKLTINGTNLGSSCLFQMSGGTLNISRYFALSNSSSFEMSGGTINVNSLGGTSSTDIFYVPSGTSFTMSSGTINILNGNLGSGVALKFNPTTSNTTGGTINFTNVKGYSSTTMVCANDLYDIDAEVGSGDTLIIQNMPSSTNGFSCHNFTITTGTVFVDPGFGITIANTLTNNQSAADLVVASDSTGNGTLIVKGSSVGNATIQRYIAKYTSGTGSGNGWHLISSPVNSLSISSSDFEPGSNDDLYAWDESSDVWSNYKQSDGTHPFSTFTNGVGYLVAYSTTDTNNFTGILNNSDITFTNLSYNSSKGNGWHLLGNPYSSALKWGTANWDSLNVAATAKVWNESAGNYSDVSAGTGIIPSTNGFFVQVTNASNKLTIPAADRVHDATNNYKSASATQPAETLQFKVTNNTNSYYDESRLGFKPKATEGFDPAFDSYKLFTMVQTAPSLWTVSKKEDFSTDYIPETTSAYDVPLHFKPGVSTVYHLSIKGVDSFNGTSFVLEDLKTGNKIDLGTTKEYDFSAEKGDEVDRFVLHINDVTAVPNVNTTNGLHIFSYGKTVYLNAQKALNGKVTVFNLMGQKVYESPLNGTNKQYFRLDRRQGIYFVKVEEAGSTRTHKVFIK